jgi:hypothetical protein
MFTNDDILQENPGDGRNTRPWAVGMREFSIAYRRTQRRAPSPKARQILTIRFISQHCAANGGKSGG